jgi:hypothetical protein
METCVSPGRRKGQNPEAGKTARRFLRGTVLASALLVAGFGSATAQSPVSPRPSAAPQSIDIKAVPIDAFEPRDPSRVRFGALEFRGGLELTSKTKEFGGISGLKVYPGGAQFLAVTDRGRWLKGRIVYRGDTPVGIADAQMAPILGPDGRALTAKKGWYDTEALTEDNGIAYLGIERVNKIVRLDVGKFGLLARAQPVATPAAIDKLPTNKGIECIAVFPKGTPNAGTVMTIAERSLDAAGNYRGFLIDGASPGEFTMARDNGYDVSDCSLLPGGDLLVLERHFTWTTGLSIRLRRISRATIKPGAVVQGVLLFEADLGYQIDNMEALGAHVDRDGRTVLTMISDDNFSVLQRTLLLQFALADE